MVYYNLSGDYLGHDGYDKFESSYYYKSFMPIENSHYMIVLFTGSTMGDGVTFSNIQLEEGNTATPYEPYYITNNTTVV